MFMLKKIVKNDLLVRRCKLVHWDIPKCPQAFCLKNLEVLETFVRIGTTRCQIHKTHRKNEDFKNLKSEVDVLKTRWGRPIDNWPSTNKLHHYVKKRKPDMWHVTVQPSPATRGGGYTIQKAKLDLILEQIPMDGWDGLQCWRVVLSY